MHNRNPSRNKKSFKEMQYIQHLVKKIDSPDTAEAESSFDPTSFVSEDKEVKRSPRKRPQPLFKKIWSHLKKHSAAYISAVVITLIILPLVTLNREMGEVKTKIGSVDSKVEKSLTDNEASSRRVSALESTITAIRTYLMNRFQAKF